MKYRLGKSGHFRQGVLYAPETVVELPPNEKPGREWVLLEGEEARQAHAVELPPAPPRKGPPPETVRDMISRDAQRDLAKAALLAAATQEAAAKLATEAKQPPTETRAPAPEAPKQPPEHHSPPKKRPSDENPLK